MLGTFVWCVPPRIDSFFSNRFAAVLEAASKNIGKEEFGFMPTKKIFVTSYHTKANISLAVINYVPRVG